MPAKEKTEAQKLGEKLKPQVRKFVQEYLIDLNGKEAAIRAGYSERTAASQASRMLRDPDVKEYRDALLQEQFEAIGVTQHTIAAEVWSIFQKCMQKEPVLEWNSVTKQWENKGVWTFNVKGALKALDMMNSMLPQMNQGEEEGSFEDMLDGGSREF